MTSAPELRPAGPLFTVLVGDVPTCMLIARNEADALFLATLLNGVPPTGIRAPTRAELEAFWTWRRGFAGSRDVRPLAMPLPEARR